MMRAIMNRLWLLLCVVEYSTRSSCSVGSSCGVSAFTVTTGAITTSPQQRRSSSSSQPLLSVYATSTQSAYLEEEIATKATLKEELLTLLGGKDTAYDGIDDDGKRGGGGGVDEGFMEEALYVDPITKQPLRKRILPSKKLIVGGSMASPALTREQRYEYIATSTASTPTKYVGTSTTYINLLEPYKNDTMTTSTKQNTASFQDSLTRILLPFVPIPLRTVFVKNTDTSSSSYIPMRDLFTSPTVSYLYERGWRQGFTQAGFPGVDTESIMAFDYLRPALIGGSKNNDVGSNGILMDMSCATGLFTRKFLKRALKEDPSVSTGIDASASKSESKKPIVRRLIGADYSDAMLREARQRIDNDEEIQELLYNFTSPMNRARTGADRDFVFELVRLDVGMIPMRDDSVDAVHAGAAMHCWPDIDLALSEIYRILRPNGGRYFATTFLANYFRNTQQLLSSGNSPRQQIEEQTFQYFKSVEDLRALLVKAGFSNHQIQIDVVGPSCVIIRCEK
jgi:ubiquinone/menaquinone biosynthesis C-methylase UbiE